MFKRAQYSILSVVVATGLWAFPIERVSANEALSCLGSNDEPNIEGLYFDNFSGVQIVSKHNWISGAVNDQLVFHVCSIHNIEKYIIAQNDPGNAFNPLKYSRFEWVLNGAHLYYCQQVFDAVSAPDAANFTKTPAADGSDANDKGCGAGGKFPWTELILVRK